MEWRADLTIFIFIVLCSAATVNAKWCTRSKSEIIQHEVMVTQKCNQTYEDSCSFFSWDTCTFNELVDCQVKKNISVTRYMLTEECCPGYKLDPVNNITCIRSSEPSTTESLEASKSVESSTKRLPIEAMATSVESVSEALSKTEVTTSLVDKDSVMMNGTAGAAASNDNTTTVNSTGPLGHHNHTATDPDDGPIKSAPKPPKAWFDPPMTLEKAHVGKAGPSTSVVMTYTGNNASHSHSNGEGTESWLSGESGHAIEDDDDNLLFGLSYGAYAGIICTLLFVLCVCVLIMLHVRKRSKKNAAKGNTTEIEITQKMLNVPA